MVFDKNPNYFQVVVQLNSRTYYASGGQAAFVASLLKTPLYVYIWNDHFSLLKLIICVQISNYIESISKFILQKLKSQIMAKYGWNIFQWRTYLQILNKFIKI